MSTHKRARPDYKVIKSCIKTRILPSIHDASDNLEDILLDYEFNAQIMRNLTGIKNELSKAEKSAAAAIAIAELEAATAEKR